MNRILAAWIEQLERRAMLDGMLDTGWGAGGISFIVPASDAASMARLSDDSVVVHAIRSHDVTLYRFAPNGQIDLNFGTVGTVQTGDGFDIAAQSDNHILYATSHGVDRYSPSGVFETTFKGPKLNASMNPADITAFVQLPDGSFAEAGKNDLNNPTWKGIEWFNADGSHRVSIELSGDIVQLTGQADGKLLALFKHPNGYTLERYVPGGQQDNMFDDSAPIAAPSGSTLASVSVDAQGKIYVGGHLLGSDADLTGFVVVRLLSDGKLDHSYGTDGVVSTFPLGAVSFGFPMRVAPDGRMYIATTRVVHFDSDRNIVVYRLTSDGKTDTTWGTNGATLVDVTYQTESWNVPRVSDFEFMSDGDLIVSGVGAWVNQGNNEAKIAVTFRLNVDPPPAEIVNNNGILTITGRDIADAIYLKTISNSRISATANGVTRIFAGSSVNGVLISAGDGNDYVDLSALSPLTFANDDFPVTVNGERGNDVLVGSQGNDRLVGGDDNDRLAGLAGNDWLSGSAQPDSISGGAGDDSVLGNGGRDHVSGDDGNDTVVGGDQPDILAGDNGNDSLLGEGGHDHLTGGFGIDTFFGGGGNDTFFANDGIPESVTGGAGDDTAYADLDDLLIAIEAPILK